MCRRREHQTRSGLLLPHGPRRAQRSQKADAVRSRARYSRFSFRGGSASPLVFDSWPLGHRLCATPARCGGGCTARHGLLAARRHVLVWPHSGGLPARGTFFPVAVCTSHRGSASPSPCHACAGASWSQALRSSTAIATYIGCAMYMYRMFALSHSRSSPSVGQPSQNLLLARIIGTPWTTTS